MKPYERPFIRFIQAQAFEGIAAACWNPGVAPAGSTAAFRFDPTNDLGINPTVDYSFTVPSADCLGSNITNQVHNALRAQWGSVWDTFVTQVSPGAADVYSTFFGITVRVIDVSY